MTLKLIKAKIISIEPGASYENKTYDQYVCVEFSNLKMIDLFDHKMVCSREMIGQIKNIIIDIPLSIIEKIPEYQKKITPHPTTDRPSGKGHIFYGNVKKIGLNEDEFTKAGFYSGENVAVLDVGIGDILFGIEIDHPKFKVGDNLKILAVRTDLAGLCSCP